MYDIFVLISFFIVFVKSLIDVELPVLSLINYEGGVVAEWLACWSQAQKVLGSNRSRNRGSS